MLAPVPPTDSRSEEKRRKKKGDPNLRTLESHDLLLLLLLFLRKAALEVPHDRLINAVEFAVAFRVHGREFWDSNNGRNYRVDVTYVTPPKPKVNKFVFKLSGDQV